MQEQLKRFSQRNSCGDVASLRRISAKMLCSSSKMMKYATGQEMRVGDQVKLGDDAGEVVFSIDADEYAEEYLRSQWEYLQKGVMINFKKYGLIHYEQAEDDLQLVARAAAS